MRLLLAIATFLLLSSFSASTPLFPERALVPGLVNGEQEKPAHEEPDTPNHQEDNAGHTPPLALLPTTASTTASATQTSSKAAHSDKTTSANPTDDDASASATGSQSLILPTATSTSSAANASPTDDASRNSAASPSGEMKQWKIIGIAVICISFVGGVILLITFFDSWWGFLRSIACGGRRRRTSEVLLPDEDTRNWEFKLASEDEHRYPKISTLENIVKEQREKENQNMGYTGTPHQLNPHGPWTTPLPPTMDMTDTNDPHPLAPIFRRPSYQSRMNGTAYTQ